MPQFFAGLSNGYSDVTDLLIFGFVSGANRKIQNNLISKVIAGMET